MFEQNVEVTFQVTRVFYKLKEYANFPIVLLRGGTRSSKTWSVMQKLILDWIEYADVGIEILILKKTMPSIKESVFKTFRKVCRSLGQEVVNRIKADGKEELRDMNYRFKNSCIHFMSLDDSEKIKSTEYNIIFMEEITDFTYEDFLQVCIRKCAPPVPGLKNQVIGCFNPIDENHWIKTEVIDSNRKDVAEFHSSYLDNPFLDEDTIETIEGLVDQNANFARVYRDGEWGKLDNLIFSNYSTIIEFPSDVAKIMLGIDWGFNAPMTLIKLGVKSDFKLTREVYIEELFYDTGYTTRKFIDRFPKLLKGIERKPIYCDSANPEKIKEARDRGYAAKKGKKGKNSVKNGIDFMKTLKFLVTGESSNVIKEFKSYSYKVDKKTEKVLDEPMDYMDHAMSAIRYAVYTYLNKRGLKLRWL